MTDSPRVRHRPIRPFDFGTLREDAATFYSNNKVFDGFKDVSVSKSMTSLAGNFQLVLTDKWQVQREDFDLKPGSRIHCHLGRAAVFEGYVDRYVINMTPSSRNITISGRDRTADLVDCSHIGPADYNDLGLKELAEQLVSPFGIKVLNPDGVDLGAKFSKFTIKQGESVFEALNRAAKQREIILLTSTHGNLILTKRSSSRSLTELIEGQNMEVTGATIDSSERFSEYVVKGQQPGLLGIPTDASSPKSSSKDLGITRYRPLIVINDNSSDIETTQKRANYENSFRAAKGLEVSVSVVDWKKQDGSLWDINQLVPIEAPSIGLKETLLIKKVNYVLNQNGRSCNMELVRKDAFLFTAEKKAEDDPLASLGWDL